MKYLFNLIFMLMFKLTKAKLPPTETYPHFAVLDDDANVWFYWKFNATHITFEVHGNTQGWLGVGISRHASMETSDVYVGWVNDTGAYLKDMHGTTDPSELIAGNEEQNLDLIEGFEDTWTRLKFQRKLAACNTSSDVNITEDTTTIFWALGLTDSLNDLSTWKYPSGNVKTRGMKKVLLLQGSYPQQGDSSSSFELRNHRVTIPPKRTYSNCVLFKLPHFSSKQHVISIEPVIRAENQACVRQMLVYKCRFKEPQSVNDVGRNRECPAQSMPPDYASCHVIMHGWMAGNGNFRYPPNVGLPLGDEAAPEFVLLVTNYMNEATRSDIVDDSGFRFMHTSQLRQHDAGVLMTGHANDFYSYILPPNAKSYPLFSECPTKCLQPSMEMINAPYINIFGVLLHGHSLTRRVTLHHVKKPRLHQITKRQLEKRNVRNAYTPIVVDHHYDYNYQSTRVLLKERKLYLGESIQTICDYNTLNQRNFTMGGLGDSGEMCVAFIHYYPKVPLTLCQTYPDIGFFYDIAYGVINFKLHRNAKEPSLNDIIVTEPKKYRNFTLPQVMWDYQKYDSRIGLYISNWQAYTTRNLICRNTTAFVRKVPGWSFPAEIDRIDAPPPSPCVRKSGTAQHLPVQPTPTHPDLSTTPSDVVTESSSAMLNAACLLYYAVPTVHFLVFRFF